MQSLIKKLENMCCLICTEFTVMSFTCEDFFRLHCHLIQWGFLFIYANMAMKIRKPKPWNHPQPIKIGQLRLMCHEFWDTPPNQLCFRNLYMLIWITYCIWLIAGSKCWRKAKQSESEDAGAAIMNRSTTRCCTPDKDSNEERTRNKGTRVRERRRLGSIKVCLCLKSTLWIVSKLKMLVLVWCSSSHCQLIHDVELLARINYSHPCYIPCHHSLSIDDFPALKIILLCSRTLRKGLVSRNMRILKLHV